MEKTVLKATRRSVTGKQVKALRRAGELPAVIYGRHMEPMAISMERHQTTKQIMGTSSSTIFTIDVDGQLFTTLLREKQRNYLTNAYLHLDFLAISQDEKIRTQVSLHFHGTAPAIKEYNGVVVYGLEQIEVECLPQYLPERIEVDLTGLKQIGDGIHVRDLKLDSNITCITDASEMIIVIASTEEEKEPVETEGTSAEPKLVEKRKKEEVVD